MEVRPLQAKSQPREYSRSRVGGSAAELLYPARTAIFIVIQAGSQNVRLPRASGAIEEDAKASWGEA